MLISPQVTSLSSIDRGRTRVQKKHLTMTDTINASGDAPTSSTCVPCASPLDSSALLSEEQIRSKIAASSLKFWHLASNDQTPAFLSRRFTARNFQVALDCVNVMGAIAEREKHHPNFHIVNYREVQVDIYTHKLNGVTENDILLAEMLDREVKIDYSPKWIRENLQDANTE